MECLACWRVHESWLSSCPGMSQTVAEGLGRQGRLASNALPNMRVQRTRSSPSALRSPLTRSPLGSQRPLARLGLACFPSKEFRRTGEMISVS